MKTKKTLILSLFIAVCALLVSLSVHGRITVKADGTNKDTFASYFTAVGDNGLVDYVDSITYGEFTTDNFSGGGIMVRTRNKTTELKDVTDNNNTTNPMLINFPTVKYSTGVKFNGVVDLTDNTKNDDTLIEIAFPGENDNWQCRGFKVIIEDASNPDKYITLFVWSPYGNTDATGGSMLAAAAASWEKTNMNYAPVLIGEAGFDTDDYEGNGTGTNRLMIVGDAIDTDGYGDSGASDGEGCFLNSKEHGHEKTSVNLSRTSANSFKIQFNNNTGLLSINGVRVRLFSKFSAVYPDNNSNARVKKYGSNVYDKFANNKVKLSVGIVRTTRRSTDEFTRFCIMNIDGVSLKADENNNIAYDMTSVPAPSSVSKNTVISKFVAIGDEEKGVNLSSYVNNISYGEFTADKFSGGGAMVQIRNKTTELVDHTENNNDSNPVLISFPSTKYSTGVKFNGTIDISDNTAYDTLLEVAFPGENDNYQVRGFKVIIEDATDPDNYIALYIWSAYGNTDALDTGKSSIVAVAVGSWETTNADSVTNAAFDTDDYNNDDVLGDGRLIKCIGVDTPDTNSDEICWLNAGGSSHGARVTSVRFSRKSDNTFKIQFDNETGTLLVNGVRVRKFSTYSTDGEHYYEGFTNDKVTVSIGVLRSVRRSTDEFTRFCIMQIDGNSLKADSENNIHYYGEYNAAPTSGLIASGNTAIPAPQKVDLFADASAITAGVTVDITNPNNQKTTGYSAANYDFDLVGTYSVKYYVNGETVGTSTFTTAAKVGTELSEIKSFEMPTNLFAGKKISLKDFTVVADDDLTIESATVTIYDGETLIATETADANWTYALTNKGELTFKLSNDDLAVKTTATVLPGIIPSGAVEHGSVIVDETAEAVQSVVGLHTLTLTPDAGYRIKSLTVNGTDVTSEVEDGEYEFEVETLENNVVYAATFEAIPTYTVTFKADDTTLSTVTDVVEGTLLSAVTAPTIPAKEGYDIVGWDTEATTVINANTTVNAVYSVKSYTITFDAQGGSQVAAATYTAIENTVAPTAPTKTGYTFGGWYNGTEEYTFGSKLTGNITLTAKWTIIKITVTIKISGSADVTLEKDYNGTVTEADLTEKAGYTFDGFFTNEAMTTAYDGEGLTENTTLYAKYTKVETPTTQAPVTQAPTTQAPTTNVPTTGTPAGTTTKSGTTPSTTNAPKKGCKSSLVGSMSLVVLGFSAIAFGIKRRKETE